MKSRNSIWKPGPVAFPKAYNQPEDAVADPTRSSAPPIFSRKSPTSPPAIPMPAPTSAGSNARFRISIPKSRPEATGFGRKGFDVRNSDIASPKPAPVIPMAAEILIDTLMVVWESRY